MAYLKESKKGKLKDFFTSKTKYRAQTHGSYDL